MILEIALPLPIEKTFYYEYESSGLDDNLIGKKVKVVFGKRRLIGIIVDVHSPDKVKLDKEIKKAEHVFFDQEGMPEELLKLARWMADYYCCSFGEALLSVFPVKAYSRGKSGVHTAEDNIPIPPSDVILNEEQTIAFGRVAAKMDAPESSKFLLYGITGSGKTEIYLKLLEKALKEGGCGIFLLPEISLTPQFIKRCQTHFPNQVALWHSRLNRLERKRYWDDMVSGRKKIALGVRSAVFAPFKNIKIIIIDEEQEDTYKQESKPMYNTRDIAFKRADYHKAAVLLGSATPDIVSYHKALTNEYELLTLKKRFGGASTPGISLVDLKKNRVGRSQSLISDTLLAELKKCTARREQAILFLNRRGYAPNCMCQKCSWVAKCPRCSISLVKHELWAKKPLPYYIPDQANTEAGVFSEKGTHFAFTGNLKCHYCGYHSKLPKKCPECSNPQLIYFGVGTQKLEKELRRLLPEARIFRMDYDTTKEKNIHEKIYDDFKKEKIDILVGTQMISKGFDFPRVTLVGIVDADIILHLPDFRATEKTFRMIIQVAGRSGRKELAGRVYVQTYFPENYIMQLAVRHDYEHFYNEEIKTRQAFNYPPFSDLINIVMSGKNEQEVSRRIEELALEAKSFIEQNKFADTIAGPSSAFRPLLRNMYRYQMLIRTSFANKIPWSNFFKSIKLKSALKLSIDIDPQQL